jgi:hypothetical protein
LSGIPSQDHLGLAFALGSELAAALDSLEDVFPILVELQLGDDDIAGVDADRNTLPSRLLSCDPLN